MELDGVMETAIINSADDTDMILKSDYDDCNYDSIAKAGLAGATQAQTDMEKGTINICPWYMTYVSLLFSRGNKFPIG